MKIRFVIERRYAEAYQSGNVPDPFTQPVRALIGEGEIPPVYIEIIPDKQGGLHLRGSAKLDRLPIE